MITLLVPRFVCVAMESYGTNGSRGLGTKSFSKMMLSVLPGRSKKTIPESVSAPKSSKRSSHFHDEHHDHREVYNPNYGSSSTRTSTKPPSHVVNSKNSTPRMASIDSKDYYSSGNHNHKVSASGKNKTGSGSGSNADSSSLPSATSGISNMISSMRLLTPRLLTPRSTGTKTVDPAPSSSSSSNGKPNTSKKGGKLVCDKCDGNHLTDECPHFKKPREAHPDATSRGKGLGSTPSTLPGATLRNVRVIRQPGDGSCLFHSLSYGLKDGSNATSLRADICRYISANPQMKISDTPISDWVKWDSGSGIPDYVRKMSRGAWGGGIEMAVVTKIRNVNVHVYEKTYTGSFKRISAFDLSEHPENRPVVRVLYCGGVHYGQLVMNCVVYIVYR